MSDDEELKVVVDLITRIAKDPRGVMVELSEAMVSLTERLALYHDVLTEIARKPGTMPGWLASEALRGNRYVVPADLLADKPTRGRK